MTSDGAGVEVGGDVGRATSESGTSAPTDAEITEAREVAFRVARARNLSPEDAEDLAQTVAERLLRQQPVPDNVAAWAQTVAKNAIIDVDRKRKKVDEHDNWVAREVGLDANAKDGLMGVALFLRQQRATSAQGMQRKAGEEMMALLATLLSQRELELLQMVGEGRSQAEIAEALGYRNAETVKATLARARGKLKGISDVLAGFASHPRPY